MPVHGAYSKVTEVPKMRKMTGNQQLTQGLATKRPPVKKETGAPIVMVVSLRIWVILMTNWEGSRPVKPVSPV